MSRKDSLSMALYRFLRLARFSSLENGCRSLLPFLESDCCVDLLLSAILDLHLEDFQKYFGRF